MVNALTSNFCDSEVDRESNDQSLSHSLAPSNRVAANDGSNRGLRIHDRASLQTMPEMDLATSSNYVHPIPFRIRLTNTRQAARLDQWN